jgi:hypothetical protein
MSCRHEIGTVAQDLALHRESLEQADGKSSVMAGTPLRLDHDQCLQWHVAGFDAQRAGFPQARHRAMADAG